MAITLSLWSAKKGEIRDFLERFYDREVFLSEEAGSWINVYDKPLEAVDLICAVMDNAETYGIKVCIQLDHYDLCTVTSQNYNDLVKGIFQLYYVNNEEVYMCLPEN